MECEAEYKNLRHKLDVLGYLQPLPLAAVSLVNALFEDLIKTTESLRDSKLQIDKLLEEKSCWELGVEPYKCDNSRLLYECNQLHLKLQKQKDEYEEIICDYQRKIRNLNLDKKHLEEHCMELENQIRNLASKSSDLKILKNRKDGVNMNKKPLKPFISTVRSGVIIPPDQESQQILTKCGKCHASINWSKVSVINAHDIEKLQNDVKEQSDLVNLYRKKLESRDREIQRLNELLSGGRPITALAKDCCYKDVGTLSEDIEVLQKEKAENLQKMNEYQGSMHEAMQKAIQLADRNQELQNELEEFKKIALEVEEQANREIDEKTHEINKLKRIIQSLEKDIRSLEGSNTSESDYRSSFKPYENKRKLHERLNELTLKEQELRAENDKLNQKYQKIKAKLDSTQKENNKTPLYRSDKSVSTTTIDEEKIRLKSERDLYQKEYLQLLQKGGCEKEIEFLKSQIKTKDNELKALRSELSQMKLQGIQSPALPCQYDATASTSNACVQAAILRAERERDLVKSELQHVRCERDALHEKLLTHSQIKINETQHYEEEIQQLKSKIRELEKLNRELTTSQIPHQAHITLMKEEIDELKKRVFELQSENSRISTQYSQLKVLHEQTEKSLVEYQNRLITTEKELVSTESRLNTLGTSRDEGRNEISALKNEIAILKSTNTTLEHEKDKIVSELDLKTEKVYRLESDLKSLHKKNMEMDNAMQELKERLERASNEKRRRECELHETSHESESLRQQICALKASRDEAIHENGQLSAELANLKAELCMLKRKLQDSDREVERLKRKGQEYVAKVKKAEELLLQKEREREEMLQHYRSLSSDVVNLEGNNQSLEVEANEYKRLISEAEDEIKILREEIAAKDEIIGKLEAQIVTLSGQISNLEKELENCYDDQRLLKVDLDAMRELCEKLDFQRKKLNEELDELQNIRATLEDENEKLRMESTSVGTRTTDKLTSDTLQEVLAESRREIELQRSIASQMTKEMQQLRRKVEDLQTNLSEQSDKSSKKEALAKEYSVQVQELQHALVDDRIRHSRNSRDVSPSKEERLKGGTQKIKSREISPTRSTSKCCKPPTKINKVSLNPNQDLNSELTKAILEVGKDIHKKDKLTRDIHKFLRRGTVKKESTSTLKDRISISEHSEDIIVRRERKITNKKIIKNETNLIKPDQTSAPSSSWRSRDSPKVCKNTSCPPSPLQNSMNSKTQQKKTEIDRQIKYEPPSTTKILQTPRIHFKSSPIQNDRNKSWDELTTTSKDSEDIKQKSLLSKIKMKTEPSSFIGKIKNEPTKLKERIKSENYSFYGKPYSRIPKKSITEEIKKVKDEPMKEEIKKVKDEPMKTPTAKNLKIKSESSDLIKQETDDTEEIAIYGLHPDPNIKQETSTDGYDSFEGYDALYKKMNKSQEIQTEKIPSILKLEKSTQSTEDEISHAENPFLDLKGLQTRHTSTPLPSEKFSPKGPSVELIEKPPPTVEVSDEIISSTQGKLRRLGISKSASNISENQSRIPKEIEIRRMSEPSLLNRSQSLSKISQHESSQLNSQFELPSATQLNPKSPHPVVSISLQKQQQKQQKPKYSLGRRPSTFKKLLLRTPPPLIAFNLPTTQLSSAPSSTFRGCHCMKTKRDELRKKFGLPTLPNGESENENDNIYYRKSVICRSKTGDNRLEQRELIEKGQLRFKDEKIFNHSAGVTYRFLSTPNRFQ